MRFRRAVVRHAPPWPGRSLPRDRYDLAMVRLSAPRRGRCRSETGPEAPGAGLFRLDQKFSGSHSWIVAPGTTPGRGARAERGHLQTRRPPLGRVAQPPEIVRCGVVFRWPVVGCHGPYRLGGRFHHLPRVGGSSAGGLVGCALRSFSGAGSASSACISVNRRPVASSSSPASAHSSSHSLSVLLLTRRTAALACRISSASGVGRVDTTAAAAAVEPSAAGTAPPPATSTRRAAARASSASDPSK